LNVFIFSRLAFVSQHKRHLEAVTYGLTQWVVNSRRWGVSAPGRGRHQHTLDVLYY